MNNFLNNIIKGLVLSLLIIVTSGYLSIKLNPTVTKKTANRMILISTSIASSLLTEDENIDLDTNTKEESEKLKTEVETKTETDVLVETKEAESETKVEVKEEINEVVKETKQETVEDVKEQKQEETNSNEVTVKGEYSPNLEVSNTTEVLETYVGKITAYGPDCYGCTSGKTASGQYVMDGNIYYNDKTFGNIRIVAADKSIPFGSIIRISGLSISTNPILAIVLDRGGMVGFSEGKHSYFDLLYKSEKDAISFGSPTATFELLRRGY